MKNSLKILLLMILFNSCNMYLRYPNSVERPLDPKKKYTILICNAMQDFVQSNLFKEDDIFAIFEIREYTDNNDIYISIVSHGKSMADEEYLFFSSLPAEHDSYSIKYPLLSIFKIGKYHRSVPNRIWQLGEKIILWNDQDTTHKITKEFRTSIFKHIELYKQRRLSNGDYNFSVEAQYLFRKNETMFYEKNETIVDLNTDSVYCKTIEIPVKTK